MKKKKKAINPTISVTYQESVLCQHVLWGQLRALAPPFPPPWPPSQMSLITIREGKTALERLLQQYLTHKGRGYAHSHWLARTSHLAQLHGSQKAQLRPSPSDQQQEIRAQSMSCVKRSRPAPLYLGFVLVNVIVSYLCILFFGRLWDPQGPRAWLTPLYSSKASHGSGFLVA